MLGDVSTRFQRVMAKADFAKREKLVNLLVNSATLYTNKAIVKGNIPVDKLDALIMHPQGGEARSSLNKAWAAKESYQFITCSAPFPFGKGGGIGQTDMPII